MGNPLDEAGATDAPPIGEEELTHDERTGEAEAHEGEPIEAAAPEAVSDYEMVDPAEFVDLPKEEATHDTPAIAAEPMAAATPLETAAADEPEHLPARPEAPTEPEIEVNEAPKDIAPHAEERASLPPAPLRRHSLVPLPPPVKVAKALSTTLVSIPPPPRVPSRSMPPPPPPKTQHALGKTRVPPPPPFRRTSTSLPPPPRRSISSAPPLTMAGTVPPPRPPKNPSGDREQARSGMRTAVAMGLAAIFAAVYFGGKRAEDPTPPPSKEVAASIPPAAPQAPPPSTAAEPAPDTATVPAPEPPESKPSTSLAATEPPSMAPTATPIPAKTEAPKAEPSNSEASKTAAQKTALPSAACSMNFNTIPPSRVALDGRDLGMTPKLGVSVQPGVHIVTFANAGGKKVTSAQCKGGEQKTVAVRLPI
jgi:hypothetical protein